MNLTWCVLNKIDWWKDLWLLLVLTILTVPVTSLPLKTALAIVHCPSAALSAEIVAHRILYRKHTHIYTHAQKDTKTQDEQNIFQILQG